jgi:hypothetical protein
VPESNTTRTRTNPQLTSPVELDQIHIEMHKNRGRNERQEAGWDMREAGRVAEKEIPERDAAVTASPGKGHVVR